jgi:hypothetical protein
MLTGKYPLAEGCSNISANEGMHSGLLQHLADQGGCGRLPIGAGYGDHREADLAPGPLEFTGYFYSPASRFFKRLDIQWDAGAYDYPVRIEKIFETV